jgi:methylated-DNA-[protein]-cysteine S-methyltransferase
MPLHVAGASPWWYVTVPSPFGALAVVWCETGRGPRVQRILLPDVRASIDRRVRAAFEGAEARSSREIGRLARDVRGFLEGQPLRFDLGLADLEACSRFQRAVLVAEHGIPRGWVSTYGRIARHVRRPRAARAVGRALATNPFPIVVPCHRAVAANGELGGYQAGARMKRALLELEGVEFDKRGRLRGAPMYY